MTLGVLDVQSGCAFHCQMRFRYHNQCQKLKHDIEIEIASDQ
jgi:hypothetical protein